MTATASRDVVDGRGRSSRRRRLVRPGRRRQRLVGSATEGGVGGRGRRRRGRAGDAGAAAGRRRLPEGVRSPASPRTGRGAGLDELRTVPFDDFDRPAGDRGQQPARARRGRAHGSTPQGVGLVRERDRRRRRRAASSSSPSAAVTTPDRPASGVRRTDLRVLGRYPEAVPSHPAGRPAAAGGCCWAGIHCWRGGVPLPAVLDDRLLGGAPGRRTRPAGALGLLLGPLLLERVGCAVARHGGGRAAAREAEARAGDRRRCPGRRAAGSAGRRSRRR